MKKTIFILSTLLLAICIMSATCRHKKPYKPGTNFSDSTGGSHQDTLSR
jgi:hypothetical protein